MQINSAMPGARAVIIEAHGLFIPFLEQAVRAGGAAVVATATRAESGRLAELGPDIVVLDAQHSVRAPLAAIRTIRRAVPDAHLVVFGGAGGAGEAAWTPLAHSLGADVVLGSDAGGRELTGAVRSRAAAGIAR